MNKKILIIGILALCIILTVVLVKLGEKPEFGTCKTDEDCKNVRCVGAYCENGICVCPPGRFANLVVLSQDISFNPSDPVEGDSVTMTATVSNTGQKDVNNITVRFYDGSPSKDGKQIIEKTISLKANEDTGVTISWIATYTHKLGVGGIHRIFVKVDPDDIIPESDEDNNEVFSVIVVQPKELESTTLE